MKSFERYLEGTRVMSSQIDTHTHTSKSTNTHVLAYVYVRAFTQVPEFNQMVQIDFQQPIILKVKNIYLHTKPEPSYYTNCKERGSILISECLTGRNKLLCQY